MPEMPVEPTAGELGERRLGTIHAVAQSLAIGPMFSVALVLALVSNPDTGSSFNATLSVLVAGLGVLAIAYAIALFARRYAGAGAVYEYLTHGAHPAVGVFTAGLFFVGTLFLGGGGIYLGLGILTNDFWARHISNSGTGPRWWIFALIFLVIVLVMNYIGIRLAISAMLAFAAVSFTAMTILALAIIFQGGESGNTLQMFNPSTTSIGTVFSGVMLGILLFVGFEAAASIGEESHDPHRSIPRALIGTVAASAVFYVLMSYAISVGLGKAAVDQGAWLDPGRAGQPGDQVHRLLVRGRHRRRRHPGRPRPRVGHLRHARPRLLRPRTRRPAAVGLREDLEPQYAVGRQPGRGRRLRRPDRDLRVDEHHGQVRADLRLERVCDVHRLGDRRLVRDRARVPDPLRRGHPPAAPRRRGMVAVGRRRWSRSRRRSSASTARSTRRPTTVTTPTGWRSTGRSRSWCWRRCGTG